MTDSAQERCTASFFHGPGHQSQSMCEVRDPHTIHEVRYGEDNDLARWKDGSYTDELRAKGIEFNPASYPENMGMSGFFDEPPEDPDE